MTRDDGVTHADHHAHQHHVLAELCLMALPRKLPGLPNIGLWYTPGTEEIRDRMGETRRWPRTA